MLWSTNYSPIVWGMKKLYRKHPNSTLISIPTSERPKRAVSQGSYGCFGVTAAELNSFKVAMQGVEWWPSKRCACEHVQLLRSYLTFCDPVDCSRPGSSAHGLILARILEWALIYRISSQSRDWTWCVHFHISGTCEYYLFGGKHLCRCN